MQNCPHQSDSFPSRFDTDMHPEIQPEMQPAFEFPGTHLGDFLTRLEFHGAGTLL